MHQSRDGGFTWTAVAALPTGRITTLTPHPTDSTRVFVGTNGTGVVYVDFNPVLGPRLRKP